MSVPIEHTRTINLKKIFSSADCEAWQKWSLDQDFWAILTWFHLSVVQRLSSRAQDDRTMIFCDASGFIGSIQDSTMCQEGEDLILGPAFSSHHFPDRKLYCLSRVTKWIIRLWKQIKAVDRKKKKTRLLPYRAMLPIWEELKWPGFDDGHVSAAL